MKNKKYDWILIDENIDEIRISLGILFEKGQKLHIKTPYHEKKTYKIWKSFLIKFKMK
jgi:hypothetical protein